MQQHAALPHTDLTEAGRLIRQAEQALTDRAPDVAELHDVLDSAITVSSALADLIDEVMRQAPTALAGHRRQILDELRADLHGMRGCLTTAPLLAAPARDDLHALLTGTTPTAHLHHGRPVRPARLPEQVSA